MKGIKQKCWMGFIISIVVLCLTAGISVAGLRVLPKQTMDDIVAGPLEKFCELGPGKFLEGPIMDLDGNLWVVEIATGWVSKITPEGKADRVFHTGGQPQGLEIGADGRLYGADRKRGVWVWDPETKKLSDYCLDFQNENFHGPNDLVFDMQGGLYFTDPWGTSPINPRGAVYYVSPGGKDVRKLMDNLSFPNGIGISPDGSTLIIGECMANRVLMTPIIKPGVINIGFTRVSTYMNGAFGPDGLAIDEEGNIYQAQYGGGRIVVINPNGFIIGAIELPEGEGAETTNCTFGVGDDADTLYITEASDNVIWKMKLKKKGRKLWRDQ